jgi:DNA polymerase III gamma/tau subunit
MQSEKNKDVLYLKYRPKVLDEIIGNEDILSVLKSQLNGEHPMPRSILLHGPTGCGKTTLGRIIANTLGAKGSDLTEIDSADFRGIDTIRDIRKQSAYKPLESSCRVWILDEVHRLTGDAQSALLKALEDTPSHIYYILCTTDPQKLLPTIRGRCSQLQVRPLTDREMKILLRRVVKAEEEALSKEIYEQIIQDSLGHPRNALQILAQVLSVKEDKRLKVAKKTAEIQSKTIELCRVLVGREPWKKVANILKGLKDEDVEQIRRAVLGYCQAVLLGSEMQNDGVAGIMEEFIEPFFNSGFPGLVLACYGALFGESEEQPV